MTNSKQAIHSVSFTLSFADSGINQFLIFMNMNEYEMKISMNSLVSFSYIILQNSHFPVMYAWVVCTI